MSAVANVTLGAFDLQEVVATGGMGEVWRAAHTVTRASVAVKVLSADYANDARARAGLRSELRAAAGLDHPNIIVVFGTGDVSARTAAASAGRLTAGSPWFAMEFAEGGTLRDRAGNMSWAAVQAALFDVLAGLAHAHARGFVHGDVKPANLLVGSGLGGVKLGDFGIARRMGGRARQVAGRLAWVSPAYMAPEQAREGGSGIGPWTDLYALGCTAWTLITGTPPYVGSAAQVIEHQLSSPLPPFIPAHPIPEGVESWLRRLLVKDPALRVRHAAEARRSLALIDGHAPTGAANHPASRRASPAEVTQEITVSAPGSRPRPEAAGLVAASPAPPSFPALPVALASATGKRVATGLELLALRSFPVVGREVEQTSLWGRLREVVEAGQSRAVILRGASGVGCTRLSRWLMESAAEMGVSRPIVAWYGAGGGPARGLRSAFQRAMRLERLTREGAEADLAVAVPALDAHDRSALAGWLLGGERHAPVPRAERLALWKRLMAVLIHAPPPTGEGQPIVFLVDGVEAGSADALSLVRSTVGSSLPVLFLVTVVDELLPARSLEAALVEELLAHPSVDELRVAALAAPACRDLLRNQLGLEPSFAEVVGRRTDGNPLFVMQLLGDCVQRRLLEVTPRGVRPLAGVELVLPGDLERVWGERVENAALGLPPNEIQSVELLAVLGDPADELEWTSACAAMGVVPGIELVERLEGEGLLARAPGETAWRFVHGMFREALERHAARGGRLDAAHRACASMLSRFGDRSNQERVGRHLLAAGDIGGSLGPLAVAVEERILAREGSTAEILLSLRADALTRADVGADDIRLGQQRLLDALLAQLQNDLPRAERGLEALRGDIARHGWSGIQARTSWLAGRISRRRGRLDEACQQLRAAAGSALVSGDIRTVARTRADLGDLLVELGDWTGAAAEFEAARPFFEQLDDPLGLGEIHVGLALLECKSGHYPESAVNLRYAVECFSRVGNRVGLARAWNLRGDMHRFSGDFESAANDYRSAIRVLEATNNWMAAVPQVNLGLLLLLQGQLEAANAQLVGTLPELARHGAHDAEACVHLGLAVIAVRLHDSGMGAGARKALFALLSDARRRDPEIAELLALLRREAEREADTDTLGWLEQNGA